MWKGEWAMKSEKLQGFVIRTTPYGEINKIVTLFTKEKGKITVMAHGARKTKGKLAGVTQLFTNGIYLVSSPKRINSMGTLKQGETKVRYRRFHTDIEKTTYASAILELVDYLSVDHLPNEKMFDLVEQALMYIEQGLDPQMICYMVEIKLLKIAGIYPDVKGCPCCKKQVSAAFALSIKEGGFICLDCFKKDRHRMPVTLKTINMFCRINQLDFSNIEEINVSKHTKFELNRILTLLYNDYAGIQLKSKKFLDTLAAPSLMIR